MVHVSKRNEAWEFFNDMIVPFINRHNMTFADFAEGAGISLKRLKRFGDRAEAMQKKERKAMLRFIESMDNPIKETPTISNPQPIMESNSDVDLNLYNDLHTLRYLICRYQKEEDIDDNAFAELAQAASGDKISHASVYFFKTGTTKKPGDRILNAVQTWLRQEKALERFGAAPPDWEYEKKWTRKKESVEEGHSINDLIKRTLPDEADKVGLDMLGIGKVSEDTETTPDEEREAEVLRLLAQQQTGTPEKWAAGGDNPLKDTPYNHWSNACLIATIVSSAFLTEAQKKALLKQLYPKFFSAL